MCLDHAGYQQPMPQTPIALATHTKTHTHTDGPAPTLPINTHTNAETHISCRTAANKGRTKAPTHTPSDAQRAGAQHVPLAVHTWNAVHTKQYMPCGTQHAVHDTR